MNREQRRAAKRAGKRQSRPTRSRDEQIKTVYAALFMNSTEDMDADQKTELLLPYVMGLDALTNGSFSLRAFIAVNESNVIAFSLAKLLHDDGTDDTRLIVKESEADLLAGAEALANIGERWKARGKWGASGDEIQAIRRAYEWLSALLDVAPQGYVLRAIKMQEGLTRPISESIERENTK